MRSAVQARPGEFSFYFFGLNTSKAFILGLARS